MLIRGLLGGWNDTEVTQVMLVRVIERQAMDADSCYLKEEGPRNSKTQGKAGRQDWNQQLQRKCQKVKNKQIRKWGIVSDWATLVRAKLLLKLLLPLLSEPNPRHYPLSHSLGFSPPDLQDK